MRFISVKYDFPEIRKLRPTEVHLLRIHDQPVAESGRLLLSSIPFSTCRGKPSSGHCLIQRTTEGWFSQSLSFPGSISLCQVSIPFRSRTWGPLICWVHHEACESSTHTRRHGLDFAVLNPVPGGLGSPSCSPSFTWAHLCWPGQYDGLLPWFPARVWGWRMILNACPLGFHHLSQFGQLSQLPLKDHAHPIIWATAEGSMANSRSLKRQSSASDSCLESPLPTTSCFGCQAWLDTNLTLSLGMWT